MIREAKNSDKDDVLKFCINTFSWGDYVKDVWDFWLSEGNLFVIEEDQPIGICHAVFYPNQVWIEGIRINPNFRRCGLASKLVEHTESIAKNKKISRSLMLIDTENEPSLLMAKQLGYKIYQTWKFHSLLSKKNNDFDISYGCPLQKNVQTHYVKSWRWLPLDDKEISYLLSKNDIIYCDKDGKMAMAILTESDHFEKTLIVTLFSGSIFNTKNILSFIQDFSFKKNYQRIQILSKEPLSYFSDLEHKLSFHLMQKELS